AFSQLGTQSNGYTAYSTDLGGEAEEELDRKRNEFHEADLEHAVFNPAAAFVSQTYLDSGAVLDQIVVDARLKYLAGQLDEDGLTAELERWTSSGGQQVIDEMRSEEQTSELQSRGHLVCRLLLAKKKTPAPTSPGRGHRARTG